MDLLNAERKHLGLFWLSQSRVDVVGRRKEREDKVCLLCLASANSFKGGQLLIRA
jgi:hypothetical protein